MNGGLTHRQHECLTFIKAYIAEFGVGPSYQDINDALGLYSKGNVHRIVHCLAERGEIILGKGRHRVIRLPGDREVEQLKALDDRTLWDLARRIALVLALRNGIFITATDLRALADDIEGISPPRRQPEARI